jgi:hypothetical protein
MTTQSSLDPRINPWKRGDVCTRSLDTVGFVVSCTREYLEVRWTEGAGIEKIPADHVDDVLRVAHADGISPSGSRTNLESLQLLEALDGLRDALANRTFKSDHDKLEADNLVRRALATDGCNWDKKNSGQLVGLALKPEQISVFFKVRERFHRVICKRSRHLPL